ncbi:MAG: hypothetical protein IT372_34655 [Polyangiaceae bacterium]|nr:hypothetical protein [Polyangiaceae bacterium]
MKKNTLMGLVVLPLALLAGCAAEPPADVDEGAPPGEAEPLGAALDLDLSALEPLADALTARGGPTAAAPIQIPADRLTPSAFRSDALQAALLRTEEPFKTVLDLGIRERRESATWALEIGTNGSVLALRRAPSLGAAAPQDEGALQARAIARLNGWGIPSGEIGRVLSRRAMAQSETGGVLEAPVVDRYKTFVHRAVGGVEVEGHRAVLSHAPDGSFDRAFIVWPPLAAQSHLLRTGLSLDEIGARARIAVAEDAHGGLAAGAVKLRWKYVATPLPSGEVALTLAVSARTQLVTEEGAGEPREVTVDVSAEP